MEQVDMTTAAMRRLGKLLNLMADYDCHLGSLSGSINGGCYTRFNWLTTGNVLTVTVFYDGNASLSVYSSKESLHNSVWKTDDDLAEAVMVFKDDL